jgi:hypothetical protein
LADDKHTDFSPYDDEVNSSTDELKNTDPFALEASSEEAVLEEEVPVEEAAAVESETAEHDEQHPTVE